MKRPVFAWSNALALACLTITSPLLATDYDHEAARRVWEQKQSESDAARVRFNTRQQQYNNAAAAANRASQEVSRIDNELTTQSTRLRRSENELSQTNQEISSKERDLQRLADRNRTLETDIRRDRDEEHHLEDELRDVDGNIRRVRQRISELEREDNGEEWTCVYVDRGHEEHGRAHRASARDRATAESQAEAACLEVHGECRLYQCTQPDSSELRRLRAELQNLEREKNELSGDLAEVRRRLQNLTAEMERNNASIRNAENRLRQLRNDVATLERSIRDLEWSIDSLRRDLDRARDQQAIARANLDRANRDLDIARTDLRIAEDQEMSAKLYYEQVLNNYNTAVAAARRQGAEQAERHARKEAEERAAAVATTAGRASGTSAGQQAGNDDANHIAEATGYRFGRQSGATDDSLRFYYRQGVEQGQGLALSKARAENFPTGYNEQMATVLQADPTNQVVIDISDQLPEAPEETSTQVLKPEMKVVGNQPEPSFEAPQEPAYRVPQPDRPAVDTPSADRRYYAPDCDGHALPDFDAACSQSYSTTYVGGFSEFYRAEYLALYQQGFRATVEESYRNSRSGSRPAIYQAAAQKGAKEQGVLAGFAQALPSAQSEQHVAGVQAFNTYLSTGFLPVLGEVKLIEGYPDGNLSPGEEVTLQLSIDNYGKQNSAQELLQVRITEFNGVELDVTLRQLPSIPADTTVVLSGVLKGKLRELVQDQLELSLTAILEKDLGGEDAEVLDQVTFAGTIRQPFGITAVRFGSAVEVGAVGEGVLVVANRTDLANEPTPAQLASLSESLTIEESELEIPAVTPGESVEIPFQYTPEVTAGGNQPVGLMLTAANLAGGQIKMSSQSTIAVNRKGSLQLCLPRCDTPIGGTRVGANRSAFFPVRFDFHSEQRERGPFVLRKTGESDDRIRPANNSTVSVNLGSWGPNNSPYTGQFGYVFPAELRGTSQWVQVSLYENGTEIHRLRIPVTVE